jgi:hypothetical protein
MSAKCQKQPFAPQQTTSLLDHLVGAEERRGGHFDSKRFGRNEGHKATLPSIRSLVGERNKVGELFDHLGSAQ